MINATTHQAAEGLLHSQTQPVRRIGAGTFNLLIGVELLLLTAVLIWAAFWLLPAPTPYAAQQDLTPVVDAIRTRISGITPDQRIEVQPGISAAASNLRGLSLNGTVYYYYVEGRDNFDPLSRGMVSAEQIEKLYQDDSGPALVTIYRIR